MKLPWKNTEIFTVVFMQDIGNIIIKEIKTQTKKGMAVTGAKFPAYGSSYKKYKAIGGTKTRGENKGNKRFPRQSSKQVNPPDLRLTGDMIRDLKHIGMPTDNSIKVGWPTFGQRVKFQQKRKTNKRLITTESNPVYSMAHRKIQKRIDRYIKKEMNKRTKSITNKIG